jgi:hypothetical protein
MLGELPITEPPEEININVKEMLKEMTVIEAVG